ncbi:hypothetical protein IKE67_00215 [bacterium]|nr:hypothetical protein [bacterium]
MTTEQDLIEYFKTLGLEVHTTTKARGHLGFFLDKRIDISKNTPQNKIVPTLLHEFAHYIHSKIEEDSAKTGGTIRIIFKTDEKLDEELISVTNFIDEHFKCEILKKHKEKLKTEIKKLDIKIKADYPDFQRSKPFKEFNNAAKGNNLRYLLKFDRVRIMPAFIWEKEKIISINTLEQDFPNLKPAFADYLRLKSLIRKQRRISNRISKIKRYYKRPTELFARFVEAFYTDEEKVKQIAPTTYKIFTDLLKSGYYLELSQALKIAHSGLFIV